MALLAERKKNVNEMLENNYDTDIIIPNQYRIITLNFLNYKSVYILDVIQTI